MFLEQWVVVAYRKSHISAQALRMIICILFKFELQLRLKFDEPQMKNGRE